MTITQEQYDQALNRLMELDLIPENLPQEEIDKDVHKWVLNPY